MHGVKANASRLLSALLLTVLSAGCNDGTVGVGESTEVLNDDGVATLRVLLTDAPADYIDAAEVDIGEVSLVPAGGGGHIVLTEDGTDGYVNLLDFQGSATTPIAEAEIDAGSFTELRMVVEGARVALVPGYTFRDGSTEKDLKVPSGAQSGLKLKLSPAEGDGPLEIVPGETVLVLDFDVNRSFVLRGNFETPAGVHDVIFTPTIRVTGEDVAASISGTVTTELEDVSVEGLIVSADPTDGGTVPGYQTESGSAMTDADGNYTIFFLVPGSYDVTVELPAGLGTEPDVQSVVLEYRENETGVDFEIIDVTGSIAGTVSTSLAGVSVANLTVTATTDLEGVDPVEVTTDGDGNYLFEDLLPGTWMVTVAVPGDDQVTNPESRTVELGNGEDVVDQDFEIIEDVSGSVSGTVTLGAGVDPETVSVEGLTVTATPGDPDNAVSVTTDENGDYLFPRLAPGDWTITVEVGAGLTTNPTEQVVGVVDNEADVDIDFAIVPAS